MSSSSLSSLPSDLSALLTLPSNHPLFSSLERLSVTPTPSSKPKETLEQSFDFVHLTRKVTSLEKGNELDTLGREVEVVRNGLDALKEGLDKVITNDLSAGTADAGAWIERGQNDGNLA